MGRDDHILRANGVGLCVETFGRRTDPPLLLIGGAAASMDWWEAEFCERLAAGSRLVIRYDSRETGRSVSYPAGAPPYTQTDLVADAAGLLETLELAAAHVVGISMGGGIAQRLARSSSPRAGGAGLVRSRRRGGVPAGDRRHPPQPYPRPALRGSPDRARQLTSKVARTISGENWSRKAVPGVVEPSALAN